MKNDNNIVIIPADKGNATVLLNRQEYQEKLHNIIATGSYKKINKDPTPSTERKLSTLLKKVKDDIAPGKYRTLVKHHSQPPYIYGVAKIHKVGVPLRPIVSCVDSVCHPLNKYLAGILKPLTGKNPSYVKNSAHFVEIIKKHPSHRHSW